VFLSDQGVCIGQNLSAENMFGYSTEEALGRSGIEWIAPEYRRTVLDHMLKGCEESYQAVALRKDGTTFPCEIQGKMLNYGGRRIRVTALRDITESAKAQQFLRESEERYRQVTESSPTGIFIHQDGAGVYVNQRMADILGYSKEEMIGGNLLDAVHPEDREMVTRHAAARLKGEPAPPVYELRLVRKNGDTIRCEVMATVIDYQGRPALMGNIADITDRKKAEEALRESEERLRLALEATSDGLWDWDMITDKVSRSPSFLEMMGLEPHELPGRFGDWVERMLPEDRRAVRDVLAQYLSGKRETYEVEFPVFKPSGELVWILSRGKVIARDHDGKPLRMVGTHTDTTDRKMMEEALRESREQLQTIFQASPTAIFLVDPQGRIVLANQRMHDLFSLTSDELPGTPYVALVHPEQRSLGRAKMIALMEGRIDHVSLERRYLTADGGEFIGHLSGRRLTQPDGGLRGLLGIITDITDRKKAEEAVRRERDKAQSYLDIAGVMIVVIDSEQNAVLANKKACAVLGWDEDEVVGRNWFDTFLPEPGRETVKEAFTDAMAGKIELSEYYENPVLTKQGEERLIAWHNSVLRDPEGRSVGTLSSGEDITARRMAESALRESEERYRTLFDRAGDGIIVVDIEGDQLGRIVSANKAAAEMHGYTMEELLGLRMSDLDTPESAVLMADYLTDVNEGRVLKTEHHHRRKDRTLIPIELSAGPIEIGGHKYSLSINRDISERKKSDAERALLATAVAQAAESVEITDSDGKIVYVNPAFEKTTGYTLSEVIGLTPAIPSSGEHDEAFYGKMKATLAAGKPWTGDIINKRKDGTLYEEEVTISPVKDESGKIVNFVAVKRDVTNEVLLRKQLLEAQKMEAVGTLAGGIAHDFNNLLQVISGFAEIALFEIKEGQIGHSELREIKSAARSAAELTQGLLTFSRKVESKLRPVDLNQELERITRMLRRTLPKMIRIEMDLAESLDTVSVDPAQLQQVVMNLAVNARDAMPRGGTLSIETGNVRLDSEYCNSHLDISPGNYVLLGISDSGTGMDEKTRKHIFDPFFTTKETGKGTGLGLSIAFGIVKSHGGNLICYSEPGHGTTFKIYLPAVTAKHAPADTAPAAFMAGGDETILVVDDEESVRKLAGLILKRFGYTVLTASNGKEGLELFTKEKDRIDLVILDLVMPEMGGRDCMREILKSAPETKIIIASGYAANGQIDRALTEGAKASVTKPYDARQLTATVRWTLDSNESERTFPSTTLEH
ncbi:MAG: PAS domain S-box protein, partial [Pseudomonadota bacterium]